MKKLIFTTLFLLLFCNAWALIPERRPLEGEEQFGWLIAPTPMRIEGVGSAVPMNAIISNFYHSADAMIFRTLPGGDFKMDLVSVFHVPLFTDSLLVSGGSINMELPVTQFTRGIDSKKEDFSLPYLKQGGNFSQLKLTLFEERFEAFYQSAAFTSSVLHIYDKAGNKYVFENPTENAGVFRHYGMIFDLTDSRHDPREGIRFGARVNPPNDQRHFQAAEYSMLTRDFSGYYPIGNKDTLVFNVFESNAQVKTQGETNEAAVRAVNSLGCIQGTGQYAACKIEEDKRVADIVAANRYGTAEGLGGPNRLRAYPIGRFYGANSRFYGLEYRWNFSEVAKEFNWWFMGGIKTNFQIATFYELGTVSDDRSQLNQNLKTSAGVGFRAFISGIIYRVDIANGSEGTATSVFIDYPMDLNPIAN